MEYLIVIIVLLAFLLFTSRSARKAQQKQRDQREQAIVVGNNVVTSSGFFGRIVDVDGDAVTLESPSGDETVWMRSAIMSQMDIPLAITDEDETYSNDSQLSDNALAEEPLADDETESDDKQGSAWK
ncbi:preprotein translocase subunit YajC [Arcanobacterium pinnipediorum]|uniref:Preprotein translocase subunit YajC n=1 Tax=Arcanobacterium pinnipediorum TaxID=1503041 RepID=A0ABY5AIY6_9ACTO|nr:preprotein translocase subunit YajC [Arcanobacterium pinnipediorum]USR80164.1 preprotein translocase subunit YajC [Arcanobacterium pinnipediorum]